jgi:hypothetical protein
VLALLTLTALGALFSRSRWNARHAGDADCNGSEPGMLRWHQDRADALLPQPWLLSLSLWFYRAVMLAWSLWVAQALVGWLRWGWRQWTHGGYWIRRTPRSPHPG